MAKITEDTLPLTSQSVAAAAPFYLLQHGHASPAAAAAARAKGLR